MDPSQYTLPGAPRKGVPSLESLSLRLPRSIDGQLHAQIRPTARFHVVLDESHTSLLQQSSCSRAWFLKSGIDPNISLYEVGIVKTLSTYGGAFGSVVHDAIRRALETRRQVLNAEGRSLKDATTFDLQALVAHATSCFDAMIENSWAESFPAGRSRYDSPRLVEHVKQKHLLAEGAQGSSLQLPPRPPEQSTTNDLKRQIEGALTNWHDLFFNDKADLFRTDPRRLVPIGGLKSIDPALIIELEEKNVSYSRQDSFELLAKDELMFPYYELDVAIKNPPVPALERSGMPATFNFRIRVVLDFVYLTFTPNGEPRLVSMDWKTNALNEHSVGPGFKTREDHLTQLKHHAVYLLQRYHDVFQRFDKEIALAFERAGKPRPNLPQRLSADMVFVGDVYLATGDCDASYRYQPLCAADLDLDLFVSDLRTRLEGKVRKFQSVDPLSTELKQWPPTGLPEERCASCLQAALCPDVPADVADGWPKPIHELLQRLEALKNKPVQESRLPPIEQDNIPW